MRLPERTHLNTFEMDQTVKALTSLFPKMDWTDEMLSLFRRRIARFEIPSTRIVEILEDHKMTTRRRSPDLMSVVRALKEEAFRPSVQKRWESPDTPRPPREFVLDAEHPGVLVKDKTGKDIIVSWERYAKDTGKKLTEFRKKNPTPWETRPVKEETPRPTP